MKYLLIALLCLLFFIECKPQQKIEFIKFGNPYGDSIKIGWLGDYNLNYSIPSYTYPECVKWCHVYHIPPNEQTSICLDSNGNICPCKENHFKADLIYDSTFKWLDGMSTISFKIKPGNYPDSIYKRLLYEYARDLCKQSVYGNRSGDLFYSITPTWDDSCGCQLKTKWEKISEGKWIEISKEKYKALNKKASKNKSYRRQ